MLFLASCFECKITNVEFYSISVFLKEILSFSRCWTILRWRGIGMKSAEIPLVAWNIYVVYSLKTTLIRFPEFDWPYASSELLWGCSTWNAVHANLIIYYVIINLTTRSRLELCSRLECSHMYRPESSTRVDTLHTVYSTYPQLWHELSWKVWF